MPEPIRDEIRPLSNYLKEEGFGQYVGSLSTNEEYYNNVMSQMYSEQYFSQYKDLASFKTAYEARYGSPFKKNIPTQKVSKPVSDSSKVSQTITSDSPLKEKQMPLIALGSVIILVIVVYYTISKIIKNKRNKYNNLLSIINNDINIKDEQKKDLTSYNDLQSLEKKYKELLFCNHKEKFFIEKYGLQIGKELFNSDFKIDSTTIEMIIDCLGEPSHKEKSVLKNKIKTTYYYGKVQSKANVFVFENDLLIKFTIK